ncbi:MAG: hydroxyacylglutathione hydrolase [Pseudomonadota bacterium]
MSVSCHLYPCSSDNYGVLVHDDASERVAIVDVPDEMATRAALDATGWTPTDIWITHHHDDHIDGVGGIRMSFDVVVTGNHADAHRLPRLDHAAIPGATIMLGETPFEMIDTPGHTVGHVAYVSRTEKLAFVGDTLFALGCGRMFEGNAEQFHNSLQILAALDPQTSIYCGHEYTQANAAFALSLSANDDGLAAHVGQIAEKRGHGLPTIPTDLATELAFNPFLKAANAQEFASLRKAKDRF